MMDGIDQSKPSMKPLGSWAFLLGVILPGATVFIELLTRICASTFFDPMPTWLMALLVAAVPVANLMMLIALRNKPVIPVWTIRFAGGAFLVSLIFMLVMLPLYPISVIAIIFYGLGLLPFAPLFAIIITTKSLNRLAVQQDGVWRQARFGMLIGAALLIIADLPVSATRLAVDIAAKDPKDDQTAVTLMRWAGNENDLLRMSYGASGNGGGLSSMLLMGNWTRNVWGEGVIDDTETARWLYFRATGKAYNAMPAPVGARGETSWFGRGDEDQGGTAVGGKLSTLRLASSRIDGSISAEDNLAYAEWTTEIANADTVAGEARFTMALPEGAVASRATLWINGEPREASIAGRAETRAAYSKIVSRQRDPLLVTTTGSGRLLVQAFPVPARGTMKFRVGYSAPLQIKRDGHRSLAMPAIVEKNFDIPADQEHAVWFEGDSLLAQQGWTAARLPKGATRLKAVIKDGLLRTERPRISVPAITLPSIRTGRIDGAAGKAALSVAQTITTADAVKPNVLAILLDGSITNEAAGAALSKTLNGISPGTRVSLSVAAEKPLNLPAVVWSPEQAIRFRSAIANVDFSGGVDNIPALTKLLESMPEAGGTILWIHGPQPVEFYNSGAQLSQYLERSGKSLPMLVRYQAVPGRTLTQDDQPWFETARVVAPTGDTAADLTELFTDLTRPGKRWQVSRVEASGIGIGSPHIVRLWGADKIAAGGPYQGKARTEAIALANRLNIITPVSGAVVLETQEDYKRNGLPVPSTDKVPSVPEPHEWALIIMVLLIGGYAFWRRRKLLSLTPQGHRLTFA
jgi:Vault protein inter-alpha-trypsin domain